MMFLITTEFRENFDMTYTWNWSHDVEDLMIWTLTMQELAFFATVLEFGTSSFWSVYVSVNITVSGIKTSTLTITFEL